MREIKFRAWDNYSKSMVYVGFSIPNDGWRKIEGDKNFDLELMQFTGLLDKNGKEIYEGDIVKAFHPTELAEIKVAGEVAWNPESKNYMYAGWYIKPLNKHVVLMAGDVEYEIIGNLYENPDLLK